MSIVAAVLVATAVLAAGALASAAVYLPGTVTLPTRVAAVFGLGYAVAAPEWIAELNKVRQPYNVNALTQAAAEALLTDTGWIAEQAAAIRTGRARIETDSSWESAGL